MRSGSGKVGNLSKREGDEDASNASSVCLQHDDSLLSALPSIDHSFVSGGASSKKCPSKRSTSSKNKH